MNNTGMGVLSVLSGYDGLASGRMVVLYSTLG